MAQKLKKTCARAESVQLLYSNFLFTSLGYLLWLLLHSEYIMILNSSNQIFLLQMFYLKFSSFRQRGAETIATLIHSYRDPTLGFQGLTSLFWGQGAAGKGAVHCWLSAKPLMPIFLPQSWGSISTGSLIINSSASFPERLPLSCCPAGKQALTKNHSK